MKFRWAKDSWRTKQGLIIKFDKIEHFLSWFVIYAVANAFLSGLYAAIIAMLTGFLWEVKDAFVPWETYGFWGGDGFSWRDFAADILGIIFAIFLSGGFGA